MQGSGDHACVLQAGKMGGMCEGREGWCEGGGRGGGVKEMGGGVKEMGGGVKEMGGGVKEMGGGVKEMGGGRSVEERRQQQAHGNRCTCSAERVKTLARMEGDVVKCICRCMTHRAVTVHCLPICTSRSMLTLPIPVSIQCRTLPHRSPHQRGKPPLSWDTGMTD